MMSEGDGFSFADIRKEEWLSMVEGGSRKGRISNKSWHVNDLIGQIRMNGSYGRDVVARCKPPPRR